MNTYITPGQANDSLDRKTVLLAASSLFIFGAFIGCAVYRLLGMGESELFDNLIERYFLALFYKCDTSLDIARVALGCIFHELWIFAAVFASGFTLFSPVAVSAALLYRGVLFGFAVTLLQFSSKTGLLLDAIVYLAASFAISMLLSLLSADAVLFYYPERYVRLKSVRTKRYLMTFFRICALVCANVLIMLFLIYVYI